MAKSTKQPGKITYTKKNKAEAPAPTIKGSPLPSKPKQGAVLFILEPGMPGFKAFNNAGAKRKRDARIEKQITKESKR